MFTEYALYASLALLVGASSFVVIPTVLIVMEGLDARIRSLGQR